MKKLNRKIEYALISLKYLSQKKSNELTSVKEISSATGTSYDVMARVMQQLVSVNLLRSQQGVKGGYSMQKPIHQIMLYDLIETIEGPIEIAKCQNHKLNCDLLSHCNIRSPMEVLNQKTKEFYGSLNLHDLLQIKSTTSEVNS